MSLLEKLFGAGKDKGKTPSPQEAIQRLREIEEMLNKKNDFLEKKIAEELQYAKKHGTKNKRMAIAALRRKKRYEKQQQQIDGTLTTIEFQREALENASTNTEVLNVMGEAAKALKASHKSMNADQVHDMMDDIHEQQEIAQEISEAISHPVGFNSDVDEDDLLKELEELEQEDLDNQLLDVNPPVTDKLPSVPATELPAAVAKSAAKSSDADDMRQLEAWAM